MHSPSFKVWSSVIELKIQQTWLSAILLSGDVSDDSDASTIYERLYDNLDKILDKMPHDISWNSSNNRFSGAFSYSC